MNKKECNMLVLGMELEGSEQQCLKLVSVVVAALTKLYASHM